MKILLVDDLEENLASLEALLKGNGREVILARSGNEALGILLEEEVGLIILEAQLPVMNGLETAELIRGNSRTRQIPILFLSTPGIAWRFRFHGHEFGPTDCLYKPVDPDILRSKVVFFEELDRQKKNRDRMKIQLEEALAELAVYRTRLRQTEENLVQVRKELEQYRQSSVAPVESQPKKAKAEGKATGPDDRSDLNNNQPDAQPAAQATTAGQGSSLPDPQPAAPTADGHEEDYPLHILLAEDNQINTRLVVGLIRHRNWTVDCAANGAEAVDLFREKKFDVVLMDIQMPEMDGMEATQKIREWESARNLNRVPVIALSAHALKTDIDKALECGMDDYLTKPFRPLDLYQLIHKLTWQPKASPTHR